MEYNQLTHLHEIKELAVSLMREHGLRPGEIGGWRFKWDHAKKRGGNCNHTRRIISLSAHLHATWETYQSRDLILHEIAHALVGPGAGHKELWKKTAQEIGCKGQRCWGGLGEKKLEGRYQGTCPNGHVVYRHRRSKYMDADAVSCLKCYPRFDRRFLFTWREAI